MKRRDFITRRRSGLTVHASRALPRARDHRRASPEQGPSADASGDIPCARTGAGDRGTGLKRDRSAVGGFTPAHGDAAMMSRATAQLNILRMAARVRFAAT